MYHPGASMLGKSYSTKFWGLKNGLLQYFLGKKIPFSEQLKEYLRMKK